MTQAFNLAQLANNLNTSGQLDATDGLTGLCANANLASSGTASSSTYLRGDRTWSALPALGKVLQVVNATTTTTVITTSGTLVSTGFSASITPSSTSSRILVLYMIQSANDVGNCGTSFAIYRNGSKIAPSNNPPAYTQMYFGTGNWRGVLPFTWLDSPSTTSACTYTLYFHAYGGNAYFCNESGVSTVTLIEIGA